MQRNIALFHCKCNCTYDDVKKIPLATVSSTKCNENNTNTHHLSSVDSVNTIIITVQCIIIQYPPPFYLCIYT